MHRPSFYRSCEVLCCSMLGVDSEEMLVVALVKQNAMVTLHQLLNTRGKSILCWHAADMLPEAMLTCFAIEYGWSPCNGACTSCPPATVACVVGRRSMGEQDVKHGSKFTVMYRVRPCEALGGDVKRVRDRSLWPNGAEL